MISNEDRLKLYEWLRRRCVAIAAEATKLEQTSDIPLTNEGRVEKFRQECVLTGRASELFALGREILTKKWVLEIEAIEGPTPPAEKQ